jgi:hypothetical protein
MRGPTVARPAADHQPPSRLSRRLAAAVLLACCALLLGAAPIATARTPHSGHSQQAAAPAQTPPVPAPSAAPAEPAPVSAPTPAPSSVPSQPSPAEGGGHHGAGRESSAGGPRQRHAGSRQQAAAQATTTAGQGTAGADQSTTSQPQAATEQGPSKSSASTDSALGSQTTRKEERERRNKEARERHKEETTRRKEAKKGGHTGESGQPGEEGSSSPEQVAEDTQGASALVTPAPSSPVATIASSSSSQAPVAASTPSVAGVSQQAVDGHRTRAARRPRANRTRDRAAKARAVTAAAAALAAPVRTLRTTAHTRPVGGVGGGSRATKKPTTSSPLVTTITKIVGVVPTPIRVLIAVLAALALALAVRSRLTAVRARRLERQRGQLLEDVGLLQAALLPVAPERLGPVGTSAAYKPADGPGAGGDFYDVFALEDGQLAVIVGDVSGHGRHALPHTALLRFTLRAYLEAGLSPRDAVQTAGAVLDRQLGGQFATVVAATYNPRERLLVYACAGHPAPVVLGARSDASTVEPVTASSSPPIGVGMRTGIRQTTVSVPGRAQVCFYTDGVTEARVGTELFGAERLRGTLAKLGTGASAVAVLDSVVERADAHPDDMAACLLRVEGGEDPPEVILEELELDRDSAASRRTERFLLACGVERDELAEVIHASRAAAGRDGTAVLECNHAQGAPHVTLRREHLRYLHVPRTEIEVSR